MKRKSRAMDPDLKALKAACMAIEKSTSVRMIHANLRLMWDRYVSNPPANAWWLRLDAKNPKR